MDTQENWEKELSQLKIWIQEYDPKTFARAKKTLKSFIRELLLKQREEYQSEVAGYIHASAEAKHDLHVQAFAEGRAACLKELREKVEKLTKETPPTEEVATTSLEILGGETTEGRAAWFGNVSANFGYNKALADILSLLTDAQES